MPCDLSDYNHCFAVILALGFYKYLDHCARLNIALSEPQFKARVKLVENPLPNFSQVNLLFSWGDLLILARSIFSTLFLFHHGLKTLEVDEDPPP